VGAFDSDSVASRCPRCHTEHFLSGQTKFFLPDFLGLHHRHFVPGAPQPIDFDPSELGSNPRRRGRAGARAPATRRSLTSPAGGTSAR